jgi:hypothetical protein
MRTHVDTEMAAQKALPLISPPHAHPGPAGITGQDHRHAIVDRAEQLVGRRGQDGCARHG